MIRAIKAVSSERGRDPSEYALVAFGGNGPVFAAGIAAEMGIGRVLIPPSAGVFRRSGCSMPTWSITSRAPEAAAARARPGRVRGVVAGLGPARQARRGWVPADGRIRRIANLHYQGQSLELRVTVRTGRSMPEALEAIEEQFGVEHERTYGHRAGVEEPVELVSLEVDRRGIPDQSARPSRCGSGLAPRHRGRQADPPRLFRAREGWLEARVHQSQCPRSAACGAPASSRNTTRRCLIPPGWTARLDGFGNIAVTTGGGSEARLPVGPSWDQL